MKKFVCLLAGAATMATVSMAQTNVLSQNAVGYVRVTVPASGGLALVRMDFESIDGTPSTISSVVGDQLPASSFAHVWDAVGNVYVSAQLTRGGWSPDPTVTRGTGFWLQNSATGPEADVYLMGEVPGSNNNSDTTTVTDIGGVDLIGVPYPVSTVWATTSLADAVPQGSFVHQWNSATQSYTSSQKTRGGWSPDPGSIAPGQGFWVEAVGAYEWVVTKPYVWP